MKEVGNMLIYRYRYTSIYTYEHATAFEKQGIYLRPGLGTGLGHDPLDVP